MSAVSIWLAYIGKDGKKYRKLTSGYPCEIHGVTMMVHHVTDAEDAKQAKRWRVSDPVTGYKAGGFTGHTRKAAILNVNAFVYGIVANEGKPFTEIIEDYRKLYGSVMDLPERKADGN